MLLVINMIEIGLTGWGDHDTLYEDLERKTDKLKTYASHFPIVELMLRIMRYSQNEI